MASSSQSFAQLPVEEDGAEVELRHALNVNNGNSHEEILDGLLARVGYGLFQKKLLVRSI